MPSDAEVSFTRDLGLFDASMIGIGAMIGAGIFVLTGIAAGEAGPAAILSFALNGLVTLLTALCYAELASAYPKSGGGYSYISKAFPGPTGFAAGWMLWFSYIIACALRDGTSKIHRRSPLTRTHPLRVPTRRPGGATSEPGIGGCGWHSRRPPRPCCSPSRTRSARMSR